MNSTQSTAAASGGAAGAAVTIVVYILGLYKIAIPPEVAAAMMVVATPIIHWVALWMQKTEPTPIPAPIPTPTPTPTTNP